MAKAKCYMLLISFMLIFSLMIHKGNSQTLYFPDLINEIYYTSDSNSPYLYSAGYYTRNTINPYLQRQAIGLTQDKTCTPTPSHYNFDIVAAAFASDFTELYANSVYNPGASTLSCDFPVLNFQDTNYVINLHVTLINTQGAAAIGTISASTTEVCQSNIPANGAFRFMLSIELLAGGDYQLTCLQPVTGPVTVTALNKIVYGFTTGTSSPAVSFYIALLPPKAPGINFTKLGATQFCSASNPCIERYGCVGGSCLKCHYSCRYCSSENNQSSCKDECSIHSAAYAPNISNQCDLDYVDVSRFEDFTVTNIDPPRTNRLALGFWVFITDLENVKVSTRVFSVRVNDYLMISFGVENAVGPTELHTFCHVNLKHNFVALFNYVDYFAVGTSDDIKFSAADANAKWVYTTCGMSYEHQEFFFNTKTKPLPMNGIYGGVANNLYPKTFYREGDFITLSFLSFGAVNTKVYIRNLIIIKEYLPDINLKYYDIGKFVGSPQSFPELLYVLPFRSLKYKDGVYTTTSTSFSSGLKEVIATMVPQGILAEGTIDLTAPKNFKKLPLLTQPNLFFSSADLYQTRPLTKGTDDFYVYEDNKAFSCNDRSWVKSNGQCSPNCDIGTHTSLPGNSETKGHCNYKCKTTDTFTCLTTNSELLTRLTGYTCKNPTTHYRLYHNCYPKDSKMTFQYNSNYLPRNMILDFTYLKLDSYFIEFWFFRDTTSFRVDTNNVYLFYSNIMQLYQASPTDIQLAVSFGPINQGVIGIITNEWNHIVFNVYHDIIAKTTRCTAYINFRFSPGFPFLPANIKLPLTKIYFCNGDPGTCDGNDIKWGSGFYKNLRIWDGNYAQPAMTKNYNYYYPNERLDSVKYYYPLYDVFIKENKIYEDKSVSLPFYQYAHYNPWDLQQYNYMSKFDRFQDNPVANSGQTWNGPGNCGDIRTHRCFEALVDRSYECKPGNYLDHSNNCQSNGNYVFKSPDLTNFKLPFGPPIAPATKIPAITVTLWMKVYGFTFGNSNMIYYSDNLKLMYSTDEANYGINLANFYGTTNQILSTYSDIRKLFGKWTFVSVAYYDSSLSTFYPPMLRFEIDKIALPITGDINSLRFTELSFDPLFYSLIKRVNIYHTFLVGAYAYDKNTNRPTNPPIPEVTIARSYFLPQPDCNSNKYPNMNPNVGVYNCEPDTDPRGNQETYTINQYISYDSDTQTTPGCHASCISCFHGTDKTCTCNFINNNHIMLLGNIKSNYCYKKDYIDFARNSPITLTVTPTRNNKLTLHFWVFAYSYVEGIFKGITLEWTDHVKIQVTKDTGVNDYIAKCTFASEAATVPFKMSQWNFLHCSVDYPGQKYYFNTYEEANEYDFSAFAPAFGVNIPFKLSDDSTDNDWGVLFFRQIRLWEDAFYSSSFLAKIDIKTPTKFSALRHQWDPIYAEAGNYGLNQQLNDLVTGAACALRINYQANKIGTNIVDDTKYSTIGFCNENGEYYDIKTDLCISFIDLSKLPNVPPATNSFTMGPIAVSYSKNYSIAFWLFLENETSLTSGIKLRWSNHMQITIIYRLGSLEMYCFPQYYPPYAKVIDDNGITIENKDVLNKAKDSATNSSGKWQWIICSHSYYNRRFFLNKLTPLTLIPETLYDTTLNDAPLGYFFHNNEFQSSQLTLQIINSTHKVYFRSFYLFKEYMPQEYTFQYMDITKMKSNEFPPLTFAMNFAKYDLNVNLIEFTVHYYNNLNLKTDAKVNVQTNSPPNLELSSNFVYLPLCDPTKFEKYNPSTNLCESITCNTVGMKAIYCMDETTPLACVDNNYINLKDGDIYCESSCSSGTLRSPGSFPKKGLCASQCLTTDVCQKCPNESATILAYENSFQCKATYKRIDYQCFDFLNNPNQGALYYAGCNNPLNIYHTFDSKVLSGKSPDGYILEFWFMIDNVLCPINTKTTGLFHYLYALPHEFYYDAATKQYIHRVKTVASSVVVTGIHQYEWNKILIFTDILNSKTQLYVNFIKTPFEINGITSILKLTHVAFCTKDSEPPCIVKKTSINWASAYYNNLRVWNIQTATFEVIQSFNNKIYQEIPKALLLDYPLTIERLDGNKMANIIPGINEDIKQINTLSVRPKTEDNISLYNYSSMFDWGLKNLGKFVFAMTGVNNKDVTGQPCDNKCKRCYQTTDITKCYECISGYVLIEQTCIDVKGKFFLKTPGTGTSATKSISLKTIGEDGSAIVEKAVIEKGLTINFWFKFLGIVNTSIDSQPRIFSMNDNTYLVYDIARNCLILSQGGKDAFIDTKFKDYFGKWIPISIANYYSDTKSSVYPNMLTLAVNRIDIPFQTTYSLPTLGIEITQLTIGNEIIALYADMIIYRKLYQGVYGKVMATSTPKSKDMFVQYTLTGSTTSNCITDSELVTPMSVTCAEDYQLYVDEDLKCDDDSKFFNPINDPRTCDVCHADCSTLCFEASNEQCTCDMFEGKYWLRRKVGSLETYCELIPYLDFATLNPINIPAPMSKTKEFTIELWVFIYSYNKAVINFGELHIEWSLQNKIYLYNDSGALKLKCYPLYDSDKPSRYIESKPLSLAYYKWNYIKCGTDLLNSRYFLDTIPFALMTKDFPAETINSTTLKINQGTTSKINYGYIFLRNIKLWQQYNFEYIDTAYINIVNFSKYPGLLNYYQNNYKDGKVEMVEEVNANVIALTRHIDYIGYNIIDPNNQILTSLITFCLEGEVWDTITKSCINTVTNPNCEFIGNVLAKCITCKTHEINLVPTDGSCVTDCPPTLFPNTNINQCRSCHVTCYRCTERFYNTCTECTGSLYFNFKDNTCVENCEAHGLTASKVRPNVCVIFDADASLVNVDPLSPIDINNFNYIEAIVIGATTTGYTTEWGFNVTETNRINGISLSPTDTPFTGDLTNLNTTLDTTFFKLGLVYNFYLLIIKTNGAEKIVITVSWNLTMNQAPQDGYLKVIPPIGLLNTTTFVMTCYDWKDENTNIADLEYQFYYIEIGTSTPITLATWQSLNEVYSNFTVRFYQLETSDIEIFCQVRDQYFAESITSQKITIINQIHSPLYDLAKVLGNYDLLPSILDINYLARSEFLKSVGINPYRDLMPDQYLITYEPSLEGSIIEKKDPNCVDDYCNRHGQCDLIDTTLACHCDLGFVSNTCHLEKNGYAKLAYFYQEMFDRLLDKFQATSLMTQHEFNSIYNLFFAAQTFIQDSTYFTVNLPKFLSFIMTTQTPFLIANIGQYVDFYDYYYTYVYNKMNQLKLRNKIGSNTPDRNVTLVVSQLNEYQNAFKDVHLRIDEMISFIIKNYRTDYDFKSRNMRMFIREITETFDEDAFYNGINGKYNSRIQFMDCVRNDQISKGYNTFKLWMVFIEYMTYPHSYDSSIYPNTTSPFVTLRIADPAGKEIKINDCGATPIILSLPFWSYTWLSYLNKQKTLFDPANYKAPDDPIFRDPIYIGEDGAVSNDTVDQRIELYNRLNNFSCLYHIGTSNTYSTKGLNFTEFNQKTNYIVFTSQHLSSFTSMFIPNNAEFIVDGRFFYVTKVQLFKYWPNYQTSYSFIVFAILMGLYLFACLVYGCIDSNFFKNESLLEFLKKEIVRAHFPYAQHGGENPAELIPEFTAKGERNKNIRHMFDHLNFDNDEDDEDNDNEDKGVNGEDAKDKEQKLMNEGDGTNNNTDKDFNPISTITSIGKFNPKTGVTTYGKVSGMQLATSGNNMKGSNNYFLDADKTKGRMVSLEKFHNATPSKNKGELPEDLTNEEEERVKSLEAYANLKCTPGEFIKYNISHRHTLVSPLIHLSLFNPRWKKLLLLLTQCYLEMLIISVMLTAKEVIHASTSVGNVILLAFLTAVGCNIVIYFLCFFFLTSTYQRRRLFNFVVSGGQLIVLKAWEKAKKSNCIYSIIGFVFIFAIWVASFWFSISFVAVWKTQAVTWLVAVLLAFFFDLVVMELLIEGILGGFFACKKRSGCMRDFGEWMNRVRSYRTLWP